MSSAILYVRCSISLVDVFANKKNVEPRLCLHNISPNATDLLHNINPLGSQHVDEEVCGWGQWFACLHGHYDHGVPRVLTDQPIGKPISLQCNSNLPTTGAAKVGGGGGGDSDSNSSRDDGDNGGSGGSKDNGSDSVTAAAAAVGATKTMAVTAMVGGTNNNKLKRQWKKRRQHQRQQWQQQRWRRLWWKQQQQQWQRWRQWQQQQWGWRCWRHWRQWRQQQQADQAELGLDLTIKWKRYCLVSGELLILSIILLPTNNTNLTFLLSTIDSQQQSKMGFKSCSSLLARPHVLFLSLESCSLQRTQACLYLGVR